MPQALAEPLLAWFARHARSLPWRGSTDPYAVWVSEIMLQQTRIETALPYYARWMERFPTVESVAAAPLDEVLRLWEGMGYYRRGVNLHRAARVIVEQCEGHLPDTVEGLRQLPGIGRYTAAAIASLAFGQDQVALDGNLRRVLSRYFDLKLDPRSAEGEAMLLEQAQAAMPVGRSSAFNQALMDLAATVCTPRSPACDRCPLQGGCRAFVRGVQETRPVRAARKALPLRQAVAGVVERDGAALIVRRPHGRLLGGLWAFPDGELKTGESPAAGLRRILRDSFGIRVKIGHALPSAQHSYTHFQVTRHAYLCELRGELPAGSNLRWVRRRQLSRHPMGKLDRALSRQWAALAGVRRSQAAQREH